jgi:tripartite motif-containing protein 71
MSEIQPPPESAEYGQGTGGTSTVTLPPEVEKAPASSRRKVIIIVIALLALLLAIVAATFIWFAVTKKPLSQLPVLSQETPPHYIATMYDVQKPIGVAVDEANDRVYVTQSGGDRNVAVFDMSGNKVSVLKPPGSAKTLHSPVYVAVDPTTSDVFVSDRATSSISVYDSAGQYLKEFKPTGVKAWQPMGVWFDANGNLFVTDVSGTKQKVLEIAPDGTVTKTMGEADGLSFPNGVATSPDGAVYVTDSNHSRALMYAPDGKLIGALARGSSDTPLGLPRGITVDDRGRIYIVDTANQDIKMFTPGDTPTALPSFAYSVGEEGTAEGSFEYPNGIAVDSRERLYITDRENNRVHVWSY